MESQELNCLEKNLTPKEVELYNQLRKLWIEHVTWTRAFIISTAYDLPDLSYGTKRLLQNPTDFAYLLSVFYGNQIAAQFEKLFTEHLTIAAQLVNAMKTKDEKTAQEQQQKWYQNAQDLATLLGEMNPYWKTEAWQGMFNEHLKMTGNEAAQILAGQHQTSINQYDLIEKQVLLMADQMACGMIKQFNI